MGLNDSYSTIKSQILITEPLPILNKVSSLILQEEKCTQIGQADLVIEPIALYVNNSNPKGFQGHQGGKSGNSKKERSVCTYCGIMGHVDDKCYKLHGYPLVLSPLSNTATASSTSSSMPYFANFSGPSQLEHISIG
ncbi:hypothetical protein ACB092_04G090700 [Castanea dentata]